MGDESTLNVRVLSCHSPKCLNTHSMWLTQNTHSEQLHESDIEELDFRRKTKSLSLCFFLPLIVNLQFAMTKYLKAFQMFNKPTSVPW